MGHDEYLDSAYRRYNLEQLSKMYKDAMKSIAIYDRQSDLSGIQQDMKEKDEKIKQMEAQMQRMMLDMQHLLIENDKKRNEKK